MGKYGHARNFYYRMLLSGNVSARHIVPFDDFSSNLKEDYTKRQIMLAAVNPEEDKKKSLLRRMP